MSAVQSTIPTATGGNLGSDLKSSTSADAASKPKPCCVCKDEKAARDECMLFSKASDAQADCADLVTKYRNCMAGYGFKI